MHTALLVGLRHMLIPMALLGVMFAARIENGPSAVFSALPDVNIPAFGGGAAGAGCNTYGFGCGGSRTAGAKFVRP